MSTTITEPRTTPGERRTERQKRYDADVLERVKRGMALLEEKYGPAWVDEIDLETLDLSLGENCVLGQVYGDYDKGCDALEIGPGDPSYGFFWYRAGLGGSLEDLRALQRCWDDVLTPMVEKR